MKKIIGILLVFILVSIVIIPSIVATGNEDNQIVKITIPEHGYIYLFDKKTIPYGFPFFNQAITPGPKMAYTYGLSIITIVAEVNSYIAVDHVVFKFMERTLNGRVFIEEYEDLDEPYQFIFSRTRVFPYRNYDIYVNAIDVNGNVLGSDSIGIGCYRSFYAKAYLLTYLLTKLQ